MYQTQHVVDQDPAVGYCDVRLSPKWVKRVRFKRLDPTRKSFLDLPMLISQRILTATTDYSDIDENIGATLNPLAGTGGLIAGVEVKLGGHEFHGGDSLFCYEPFDTSVDLIFVHSVVQHDCLWTSPQWYAHICDIARRRVGCTQDNRNLGVELKGKRAGNTTNYQNPGVNLASLPSKYHLVLNLPAPLLDRKKFCPRVKT